MFGYCHQLYRLLGTKHLALSQGFEVRLLADCYTVFHEPKTHRFRILGGPRFRTLGGGGGGGGGPRGGQIPSRHMTS